MSVSPVFPTTRAEYAAARDALLEQITATLQADSRFLAAWLGGSFGRGEADEVSDIDLFVVVADAEARALCAYPALTSAGSVPARLALFTLFGEPANLHENHNNAPVGGSFSAVLYRNPPVIVDWTLVPQSVARRSPDTRLLFDRAKIPLRSPEDQGAPVAEPDNLLLIEPETHGSAEEAALAERAAHISEREAFFWMLAAITAKYIQRGASDAAAEMFEFINSVVIEIEDLLDREPGPVEFDPHASQAEQKKHLRRLCERVESLGLPDGPRAQVEAILNLK